MEMGQIYHWNQVRYVEEYQFLKDNQFIREFLVRVQGSCHSLFVTLSAIFHEERFLRRLCEVAPEFQPRFSFWDGQALNGLAYTFPFSYSPSCFCRLFCKLVPLLICDISFVVPIWDVRFLVKTNSKSTLIRRSPGKIVDLSMWSSMWSSPAKNWIFPVLWENDTLSVW